jgi:hypothetical protein
MPRVLRSAAALVVAATAAVAIALPASASQPQHKYTQAGNALAKGVVVKLSDLPANWKMSKAGGAGANVTCKGFNPDQSDLTSIGQANSAFETKDGLGNIASLAGIFQSGTQAQTSWNRVVRPGMLTCLASILEASAGKGTSIAITSKKGLPLKVPGQRAAAYRMAAKVTSNGQHVTVYLDLIMQGGGPADTVLMITSVFQPPPPALESKLAAAVAGRLPH